MMNKRGAFGKLLTYAVLTFGALVCLFPFYWMLRTALADISELFQPDPALLPAVFNWNTFRDAMGAQPFDRFFLNSAIITGANLAGVLLTASLCAYGFSRLDWPGRDKVFGLLLTALMLPYAVLMIPHFVGWNYLGLTDTFAPLIVPAFLGGGVFNIFLLRQFFMTIPRDLDEAAFIDGASHLRVFSSIILPIGKQSLIVVGLFTFLANWNDYLAPVIYLSSEKNYTLMLGLTLFQGQYNAQWNLMMAAVSLVVLPSLVLFLFAQRYFVEGIAMTGVKG
jgi:multiple sugar transport system permease protein